MSGCAIGATMPVRSKLQQRKAEEAARERHVAARLAAHRPAEVEALDATTLARQLAVTHPHYVWRDPATFNRSVRTKDPDRIRLLAAEHVFGRYPVARHIRAVWIGDAPVLRSQAAIAAAEALRKFRLQLYLTAASGGSVHKECTGAFMTKKETHRFLAVGHTDSVVEAIWFALACSHTDDLGVARRIAVSRLAEQSYASPFWREALRFFCVNPMALPRMNDMLDFLRQEHARNQGYSLRGRTPASLAQQVEQWHRALNRARRLGDAKWDGADLPDVIYSDQPASKGRRFDWRFRQIKTSRDLAEEGTQMHHCVYSYQRLCIAGGTSIWSLASRPSKGREDAAWSRALTIEMNNASRRLVQIRGYANRLMNEDEGRAVLTWSAAHGLAVDSRR